MQNVIAIVAVCLASGVASPRHTIQMPLRFHKTRSWSSKATSRDSMLTPAGFNTSLPTLSHMPNRFGVVPKFEANTL